MSQRFAETLMQVQQQAMAANAKTEPQMAQWMQSFYRNRPAFAYSVGMNTPEGCLTIGNGSQSYANTALLPAVAVVGMLSAIAIPNFVKARATSQQNACINNLRQIDARQKTMGAGKRQTGHRRSDQEDLLPYLRKWPVCPAGGTYTIGAVGEQPTCSIPRPQTAVKNSSGNSTPLCGCGDMSRRIEAQTCPRTRIPRFARANSPLATRGRFD